MSAENLEAALDRLERDGLAPAAAWIRARFIEGLTLPEACSLLDIRERTAIGAEPAILKVLKVALGKCTTSAQ